jgi:hypothetical protein
VLPLTAEARAATKQLPSCCCGFSRPSGTSRRHQSRTSLTEQSRSTGRRRRGGAAECAQTAPPRAPCARTRGRSRRERQPKRRRRFYRVRRGWAVLIVLTAERPGLFDIVVPFPLVSLIAPNTSCGSPPPPPALPAPCASSALACCRRLSRLSRLALRPRRRRHVRDFFGGNPKLQGLHRGGNAVGLQRRGPAPNRAAWYSPPPLLPPSALVIACAGGAAEVHQDMPYSIGTSGQASGPITEFLTAPVDLLAALTRLLALGGAPPLCSLCTAHKSLQFGVVSKKQQDQLLSHF